MFYLCHTFLAIEYIKPKNNKTSNQPWREKPPLSSLPYKTIQV